MNDETLFLYLNKELNKNEQKEVEEWIEKNPEQYRKIKTIWEKTKPDTSAYKPDINGMWKNIISEIEHSNNHKKVKKIPIYKALLKYAAIFVLCFALIGYYAHWKINHIEWAEYASNSNKLEDILLPDGSTVTLNKESKLSYKKQFLSDNREVILKGEAFFQVKKNPKKTFVIYVNNTIVKVLGTSFNINASDTSGNVLVSVKSGKVMFYKKEDANINVYLTAGDMGIFSSREQKIKKTGIQNQNYLAWKTGILLFKNNTLPEVCEILSKYYNTYIMIDNPDLNAKKLTARYQNKSLPEVLELLKIALDIQYVQKDDRIFLTSN